MPFTYQLQIITKTFNKCDGRHEIMSWQYIATIGDVNLEERVKNCTEKLEGGRWNRASETANKN